MQQLVTQRIISKGLSYSIIIELQIKEGNGKANHLATTFSTWLTFLMMKFWSWKVFLHQTTQV